ncbi:ABC transporter substrate-binding protein [Halosimplex amylolyticum]|uniref:ABC transporter substrate-binding protein n=1 Tax=Halosimplex amylolyticum TaxID=3396616 RepID=UPI003F55CCC1
MARENGLSRRQWLVLTGQVGAAAAIAGCPSDSGDGGTTPTDTAMTGDGGDGGDGGDMDTQAQAGEPLDPEFTIPGDNLGGTSFSNKQFNQFVPGQTFGIPLLFGRLATPVRSGFAPAMAESWSIPSTLEEGTTVTVTIREDANWHNGDPVTAQDFVTEMKLERHVYGDNFNVWAYTGSVEATGEKTVELTLDSPVNPSIFKNQLLNSRITVKHDIYSDYLARFEEAQNEEEEKEVRSDIQSETIEDPYGNNAFKFDRKSSDRVRFVKNEDFWNADAVNVPAWDVRGIAFENLDSAVRSDTIEFKARTWPISGWTEKANWEVRSRVGSFGEGWAFNLSHEYFGQRKVRQAFAHIIDFAPIFVDWAVAAASVPVGKAEDLREQAMPTIPNGLSLQQTNHWFDNPEDTFTAYEKDDEKAMSLLREAGFSKDDGTVMTPDGDPWEPPIPAPGGWRPFIEGIANQLKEFGINAQLQQTGQFWSQLFPNGVPEDGGTTPWLWGGTPDGSANPHPFYPFEPYVGDGYYGPRLNWPDEVEVPMPVGNPDGSLETMTRQDIVDRVVALQQTSDDEEIQTLTKELAWIHNQLLPAIPLRQGIDNQHFSTDHWEWPPEGSEHDFANLAFDHIEAGWPKAKLE